MVDLASTFGVTLDPWQENVLQAAMGERSDGRWAAKRVGLSVPRQNGKSELILARALAGAILFGEKTIIISAHQQDTSRQIFNRFLELRELSPELNARVVKVMEAFNREHIKFTSGATIEFKARSGPGGRGFSADLLLLDEAQILDMRRWVSINSTMSARDNPQIWLTGTPPTPEDDGSVFESVRAGAGKSSNTAWVEWAADPAADPGAVETLASANPAWFTRINHDVVQGEFETYPPDRFALDRLGIWASDLRATVMPNWPHLAAERPDAAPAALGIASDPDQTWLALGAVLASEKPHLGIVMRVPVAERAQFLAEVVRISGTYGCPVLIDKNGPASFLLPDLSDAMVPLEPVGLDRFVQASVDLVLAVAAGEVEHGNYDELNAAVAAAGWRKVGDRQVFARRNGDISALEAVALALHGADSALNYDVMGSVL